MSLDDMEIGNRCIIKSLNVLPSIKRRLLDMGLIKGTKVECVMKSPLGDPKAYLIRGTLLAIRSEDGSRIAVDRL